MSSCVAVRLRCKLNHLQNFKIKIPNENTEFYSFVLRSLAVKFVIKHLFY